MKKEEIEEYDYPMKVRCPECKEVFTVPFSDRVDALLFGNWRKYHPECNPKRGFSVYYSPEKTKLYYADEVDSFIEEITDHRAEFRHSQYLDWLRGLDRILGSYEP